MVVLTGAGDKAFCAGADLSGMADGAGFAALHDARGELARLFREMWELGKPTVARVRGYALAGGFGLALACDLVVAADDAQFGTPEIDVGLWPYMITVPLIRSMPPKKALELMMTGRRVSAEEAERIGFVHPCRAGRRARRAVDELAATLAAKSPVDDEARPRLVLRGVGPVGRRRPPAAAPDAHRSPPPPRTRPRASPPSPRSATAAMVADRSEDARLAERLRGARRSAGPGVEGFAA